MSNIIINVSGKELPSTAYFFKIHIYTKFWNLTRIWLISSEVLSIVTAIQEKINILNTLEISQKNNSTENTPARPTREHEYTYVLQAASIIHILFTHHELAGVRYETRGFGTIFIPVIQQKKFGSKNVIRIALFQNPY